MPVRFREGNPTGVESSLPKVSREGLRALASLSVAADFEAFSFWSDRFMRPPPAFGAADIIRQDGLPPADRGNSDARRLRQEAETAKPVNGRSAYAEELGGKLRPENRVELRCLRHASFPPVRFRERLPPIERV